MKRRTKRKIAAIILTIELMAVIVLAMVWLYMYVNERREYFSDRFLPGTFINDVNVSEMTQPEAEEAVIDDLSDYFITLHFRNGDEEVIKADDFNFHNTDQSVIKQLLDGQRPYYPFEGRHQKRYLIDIKSVYDPADLREIVRLLPEFKEENMEHEKEPEMVKEDGKFVVKEAEPGNYMYYSVIATGVERAVSEKLSVLNVADIEGAYEEHDYTDMIASMEQSVDVLNEHCAASITYLMPNDEELVLDEKTTIKWLTHDEETGAYAYDNTIWAYNMNEFVKDITVNYSTVGAERTFNATDIGEVKVTGGTYGYAIDAIEEGKKLSEELKNGETVTREPVYRVWEVSKENNGFGYTYLEIDLSRQHLWLYEDGVMIFDADIVSGLPTAERYTPQGVYMLQNKESPSILKGELDAYGNPEYRTKVGYWMPFNDGIGLHDATWQPAFGGDMWLTNGSHGCVNMSYYDAQTLYGMLDYNTPIVCYYSEGSPF